MGGTDKTRSCVVSTASSHHPCRSDSLSHNITRFPIEVITLTAYVIFYFLLSKNESNYLLLPVRVSSLDPKLKVRAFEFVCLFCGLLCACFSLVGVSFSEETVALIILSGITLEVSGSLGQELVSLTESSR